MRVLTATLFVCAIGFIAADEPKKEAANVKGKWSLISLKHGGQAASDDLLKDFKCNFEEKTYTNALNGEVIEEGEYILDDSKSPKTIDFDIKKGHDEGKKQLGIFKIEDEKMTIVLAEAGGKDRPTSFKVEDSDTLIVAVLERVKP